MLRLSFAHVRKDDRGMLLPAAAEVTTEKSFTKGGSNNLLNLDTPDSASSDNVIFGAFKTKTDNIALMAEGAAKVRCGVANTICYCN